MKTRQSLLLLVAVVSFFAYSKNDGKETVADFSVLGITSVAINGQHLLLKEYSGIDGYSKY